MFEVSIVAVLQRKYFAFFVLDDIIDFEYISAMTLSHQSFLSKEISLNFCPEGLAFEFSIDLIIVYEFKGDYSSIECILCLIYLSECSFAYEFDDFEFI